MCCLALFLSLSCLALFFRRFHSNSVVLSLAKSLYVSLVRFYYPRNFRHLYLPRGNLIVSTARVVEGERQILREMFGKLPQAGTRRLSPKSFFFLPPSLTGRFTSAEVEPTFRERPREFTRRTRVVLIAGAVLPRRLCETPLARVAVNYGQPRVVHRALREFNVGKAAGLITVIDLVVFV